MILMYITLFTNVLKYYYYFFVAIIYMYIISVAMTQIYQLI